MRDKILKKIMLIFPKDSEAIFNSESQNTFGGATVQMYLFAKELRKDPSLKILSLICDYKKIKFPESDQFNLIKGFKEKDNILVKVLKTHRIISKEKPDVIIQHGLTTESCLMSFYCFIRRIKFIFMFAHDAEADRRFQTSGKKCYLFPMLIRFSFLLTVQNKYQYDILSEDYKNKKDKILLLYNGFPVKKKRKIKKDSILWVSRSEKWKRPELFIKMATLHPELKFIMICPNTGDDEYYEYLLNLSAKVKNLKFIRFVPFSEIDKYFEKALLFINTSEHEGYPQSFIQAIMNTVPILSLNVNPDNFISEYDCGKVFNGDFNQMSDGIKKILSDTTLYANSAENVYNYFLKKHNIEINAKLLLEHIDNLSGNKKKQEQNLPSSPEQMVNTLMNKSAKKMAVFFPKDSEAIFNIQSKRTFGGATIHIYHFVKELSFYDLIPLTIIPTYKHIEFAEKDFFNIIQLYNENDNFLSKFFKFMKFLKKEKPEIIMQIGLTFESCVLAFFCHILKKKFVFLYASDVESAGFYQNSKKKCYIYGMLLRHSSLLIAQNEIQKDTITGINKKYTAKTKILKKGIDFSKLKKVKQKKFDAIWVARCEELKNVEACIKLAEMNPSGSFVIICPQVPGKEAYHKSIVSQIEKLPNIKFISFARQEDIYLYLAESKFMIITSQYEGDWPLTVLEAVSSGLPIISLNLNYGTLIEGYNAGFFCNRDIQTADNYFKKIVKDKKLLKEMSLNATRYSRDNHDIKKNASLMYDFLANL